MPEKVVPEKVVPEETVWIITDGKAGDLNPCLGVVDLLKLDHVLKTIERDDPGRVRRELAGSVLPSLAIASGRRAIPTLKAVKRASLGRCFTVYLKDPRTIKLPMLGSGAADLIWAPDHDALGGSNALSSLTSPHRLGANVLAAARALPDPRVAQLPEPRVAILLGGDSRVYRFDAPSIARFTALVDAALDQRHATPMATVSRRTPPALREAMRVLVDRHNGFLFEGDGDNPLASMLALANHVIVTADSVNMASEALTCGVPVHIFEPAGGSRRIGRFIAGLLGSGAARRLAVPLETWHSAPVDATVTIAAEIRLRLAAHRERLRASERAAQAALDC